MTEYTPAPWGLLSRGAHGNDGELFGWDLDGPPEPAIRGAFANYSDALLAAAAPNMFAIIDRLLTELQGTGNHSITREQWMELEVAHAIARGDTDG